MHLNTCLGDSRAEVCSRSLAGGTLLAAGTLLGRGAAAAPSPAAGRSALRDFSGTKMGLW